MAAALVFVGLIAPVAAANPSTPLMAVTNTPVVTSATGVSANSTLIPLTTAFAQPGDPSAPLIITLQPAHPPASTPPQTNTTHPPIAGTPRPGMATVAHPAVSPAKGAPTRTGRSPTTAASPAINPVLPVIPTVTTPIPTVATIPTPVPTATTAIVALVTAIAASPDAATATPTDEMTATPTLIPGIDALPTVAVAAPDFTPNEGQAPLISPTKTPALFPVEGNLGMIVAFSLFVLVLGATGVVSGIWGMVRARRASGG